MGSFVTYISILKSIDVTRANSLISVREATEADAARCASLLAELGYSSEESEVRHRLAGSLARSSSRTLVAQSNAEVVGCLTAELVPYFPNGSTVCRVTAVVVSATHRNGGVGETLLAAAAEFARDHRCSGVEVTSAEHRVDAHRFYERLGFSRTSFRFFRPL